MLHAFINEHRTQGKKNDAAQGRNFWLGVVTAFIVLAYTTVTFCQLRATRDANQIARDALSASQRPWVGPEQITIVHALEGHEPLVVKVRVENGGHSPAIHVDPQNILSPIIVPLDDTRVPFTDNPESASCRGPKPQWSDDARGGIILPGAQDVTIGNKSPVVIGGPVDKVTHERIMAMYDRIEQIVDPQDVNLQGLPQATPLAGVSQWQLRLFWVGCINYFDVSHEAHRTSFCYVYIPRDPDYPSGHFRPCELGNSAD
jgi:hypothetical protein